MITLSAMLLAGGQSRRMGTEKATMLVAGGPLWKRQLRVLQELQPAELWVSARAALPWCPPGIEVVLDKIPGRGPLSGVAAGLRRLQTSHLLVLAVDLPQMTSGHLSKLWGMARPGQGVIPRQGDYFEPLCAIYPVAAAGAAESALGGNNVSLQSFAELLLGKAQAVVYDLTLAEQPLYLNMNTPADVPRTSGAGSLPQA